VETGPSRCDGSGSLYAVIFCVVLAGFLGRYIFSAPSSFFWATLNFSLFVFILRQIWLRLISPSIVLHRGGVSERLSQTAEGLRAVESRLKLLESRLEEFAGERDGVLNSFREEAKVEGERIARKAEAEVDYLLEQVDAQIRDELRTVESSIRTRLVAMAVDGALAQLGGGLDDDGESLLRKEALALL